MAVHVVVGRGPIGSHLVEQLTDAGDRVRVVVRTAPRDGAARPDVEYVVADAADPEALTRACAGAGAIYNCVNPPYHRWPRDWPPVMDALLAAAESSRAVLVTAGNLYSYGPGAGVMRETTRPGATDRKGRVRQQLWELALNRHRAERVRATEVRGSDYLGPLALDTAHAGTRVFERVLTGATVRPIGNPDAPHSWTYLPDFARALRAAARDERAWGRVWHAPTPEPRSMRELVGSIAATAAVPVPKIAPIPLGVVRTLGLVVPTMREIGRIGYQFTEPFVVDSSAAERELGLSPTDWPTILTTTVQWWRSRLSLAQV